MVQSAVGPGLNCTELDGTSLNCLINVEFLKNLLTATSGSLNTLPSTVYVPTFDITIEDFRESMFHYVLYTCGCDIHINSQCLLWSSLKQLLKK